MIRRLMPWGLSLAGLLLLVVLYTLPRWVVDNVAEATRAKTEAKINPLTMHALPMSVDVRMQLLRWKANWQREQKWHWADTLAYVYLRYERIDSALRYVAVLQRDEVADAQRRAGLHLYRAYILNTDSSQRRRLGNEARRQLMKAAAIFPEDYRLQVKAALTYMQTSEPMRGIRLLQALYKTVPEDADVLLALGRLSLQTGQYKKGEEKMRKLLQLYPTHVEGSLYLGRYLIQNGKKEEGRMLLQLARKRSQDPALQQILDTYLNP